MTQSFTKVVQIFCVILFYSCDAIKINSVNIPESHDLKAQTTLRLDCLYTVEANETRFALKWLHNSTVIYQWIPLQKFPDVLGGFKGRVDKAFVASADRLKKHSSLMISKTLPSDSGVYTCSVETFQGSDEKSGELVIISPEIPSTTTPVTITEPNLELITEDLQLKIEEIRDENVVLKKEIAKLRREMFEIYFRSEEKFAKLEKQVRENKAVCTKLKAELGQRVVYSG